MHETLRIFDTDIVPGERATIDIPLPNLYTHTRMHMPVRVIRGSRPGPRLLVSAALHGDEINGVEIIRRLLSASLLDALRGTLIAVPVVNVFGFVAHSRYLPDRRDLNRTFPGSKSGSLTARLAHLFLEELFAKASHGIDLHTGAIHRTNLPQVRAQIAIPEVRAMAEAFGAPVILDSDELVEGSLRQVAMRRGIPYIVYEGGEALRFDESAISAGVKGVLATMRSLAMLPPAKPIRRQPVIARDSSWVRAPQSGIVRAAKALGARVAKDEVLAWVSDPFGEQEEAVRARFAGLIVGRINNPLVNEGEALFHIARLDQPASADPQSAERHEELSVGPDPVDPYAPPPS
ncbi:MAG: succinylglutamate desuccinylase/aspartoacylase family protein [Gammaproteobacteria bacterium]